MARFTLRERPGTGIEVPDPNPPHPQLPPPHNVGDQILFIDRELEDRRGNLVGTLVSRCTIVHRFTKDDLVVAFTATNKLNKGMINTQGVIRFNDFGLPNGVTFAIVGGTRRYKKARGTVTGKFVPPDSLLFTFRVF
jgi:Allene oxide cyclase barrel like domain